MYKVTVLYGHPDDPTAFDEHYERVHIPLASQMRGLTGWTITRPEAGHDGEPPAYHLIAELWADTRKDLLAIFDSPEGRAAADVAGFATGGATFLYGEQRVLISGPSHMEVAG